MRVWKAHLLHKTDLIIGEEAVRRHILKKFLNANIERKSC